jgi:hypothetical protein
MNNNDNEILSDIPPVLDVFTEQELILYLRIPHVSKANDHSNVVKNLIRFRDLPRIQICNKLLFPKKAILEWLENETIKK